MWDYLISYRGTSQNSYHIAEVDVYQQQTSRNIWASSHFDTLFRDYSKRVSVCTNIQTKM